MTSSFATQARQCALDGKKMEFVHDKLIETGDVGELTACFDAALLCVSENPAMRPVMGQVVRLIDKSSADTNRAIDTVIEIGGSESGFEEVPILGASPHDASSRESPPNEGEGEALQSPLGVVIDSGEFGKRNGKEHVPTVDRQWG